MARLNEPAAPTETLESLKRKFMRQNRDIARANSTQSLRIRNLENEVSRLLADNLGLREQILRLTGELENGRAQRVADHTGVVKSQLEAKLLELSQLISGLGDEDAPKKKSPRTGKIIGSSPSTSPSQRNWKNMCTLSDAMTSQEGRLPPIQENKLYPRRTLERQEILDIAADVELDSTDSPEIGPPPVSQFVDEDPVKIDLPQSSKALDDEEPSGMDPVLSINLEQRKKRKDSTGPSETRRISKTEVIRGVREASGSLKTGAKRKLSVRDDEECDNPTRTGANSPDDFQFTRVATEDRTRNSQLAQSDKSGTRGTRELAVARGASRDKPSIVTAPVNRKVLAPKSVNDSPRKGAKATVVDGDSKVAKAENQKPLSTRERSKERKREPTPIAVSIDVPINTVELHPEPETPAGLDIFSPLSSQPSTARAESRDTPPPSELGPGTEGQRPSRRVRGAVSYAEPNLRDKMRRPTKELVDAVTKDGKAHRGSNVKLEEDSGPDAIRIKKEPEAEDAWKRMPAASSTTVENSPLSSKGPETLPSSITTHRKRRESLLNQQDSELTKSSSGSAIAALLAESRRVKAAAREKQKALDSDTNIAKAMERLDIYEFKGSSPQEDAESKATKEEAIASRFSRRHSSVPQDLPSLVDSEGSDMEGSRKQLGSISRRRQSTLGMRSSSATSQLPKDPGSEKELKKASSTVGLASSEAGEARNERIGARRRSMML